MAQPPPRSKDDPNHSGADDGLHVWERDIHPDLENMSEEEAIEIFKAFANNKGKKRKGKKERSPKKES
jgi:hypothetical protein